MGAPRLFFLYRTRRVRGNRALDVARSDLHEPLSIERSANLLYKVTVDNALNIRGSAARPVRGGEAFQTDLCVFERKSAEVVIPRMVLEFKTKITTHDVMVYGTKARRHKQICPYLRYGIVAEHERHVSQRVFNHNESLDFCAAVAGLEGDDLRAFFASLFEEEVAASRCLESIFFEKTKTRLFRNAVTIAAR